MITRSVRLGHSADRLDELALHQPAHLHDTAAQPLEILVVAARDVMVSPSVLIPSWYMERHDRFVSAHLPLLPATLIRRRPVRRHRCS